MVYIASKKFLIFENNKENIKFIIQFVLEKIAPCFSEELMILMTKYEFGNKYGYFYTFIYESLCIIIKEKIYDIIINKKNAEKFKPLKQSKI